MSNQMTPDCPSFMQFLAQKYKQALQAKNVDIAAAAKGNPVAVINVDKYLTETKAFIAFAEDYMAKNRPIQLEHGDSNYIVKLNTQERFFISPPATDSPAGSMQPAHAVPVTGRGQIGNIDFGDGIPLTPAATSNPAVMAGYTLPDPE